MKFAILKTIQERDYIVGFASSVSGLYRGIMAATPKVPSPVYHKEWNQPRDGTNVVVWCGDVDGAIHALFGKGFKSVGFRHAKVMGDDHAFAILREDQASPFAFVRVLSPEGCSK